MKYNLCLFVLFFIFCSSSSMAQTDVRIRKSEFRKEKDGFSQAWKHITDGDSFFRLGGIWYSYAFEEYKQAALYNDLNPELNYKTGVTALLSDEKDKALEYFIKAAELTDDLPDDYLLMTGRALQYMGDYKEAAEKINSYLASESEKTKEAKDKAGKYLSECNYALILLKDSLNVEIENMDKKINSDADDYAQVLSANRDTMFFASRRKISKSPKTYKDSKYDENIFFSKLLSDEWEYATTTGDELNTQYCEAPLYINPTGNEMYIYAGYQRGGNILVSRMKNGKWSKPGKVPFKINTKGSETSFTFSPSGSEIWFVTDKGGNSYGGKDIYFVRQTDQNKWSEPQNAGPNINTGSDEESLRFSPDGDTLWFSSKGHNSIGGYDIFYSVKDSAGIWGEAVNYGIPVNTPWDELFFFPPEKQYDHFYFSSNRSGSLGGMDIFTGRILPPEPDTSFVETVQKPPETVLPDTVIVRDTVVIIKEITQTVPVPEPAPEPEEKAFIYLTGRITDSESGDPVIAKIDLIDIMTDIVVTTTASSEIDGSYRIRLPEIKPWMIDIRAGGFLSEMKRVDIPDSLTEDFIRLDVSVIKVKVGKRVVLNNILFETGKSVLTPGSSSELERLIDILEENEHMRIEISGHTDNTGSESFNFRLSENRAKAVVDYLVKNGIDIARLEYRGYGPQQPIADNTTAEGRSRNRRVEFKILEF